MPHHACRCSDRARPRPVVCCLAKASKSAPFLVQPPCALRGTEGRSARRCETCCPTTMGCYRSSEQKRSLAGGGYIGLNGSRTGGHQPSFCIAEGLLLGREEIRNSPCNNIQDSFAVRKPQRGLAYFNLIRANLYPNGNSHPLFF